MFLTRKNVRIDGGDLRQFFSRHFIYHLTFIIYHSFGSRLETKMKDVRNALPLSTSNSIRGGSAVQCSMFNVWSIIHLWGLFLTEQWETAINQ